MVFQNNFINLTPSEMVDPVLKVSVIDGREIREGPHPEQEIRVDYDPEISAERLMVPLTKQEIEFRIKWNLTRSPNDFIPFRSDKRKEIYLTVIREVRDRDVLVLECESGPSSLESGKIFITRQLGSTEHERFIVDNFVHFVDHIMNNMLRWYNYREATDPMRDTNIYGRVNRLILVLDKEFCLHLPSSKSREFTPYSETQVVFDTCEIEQ